MNSSDHVLVARNPLQLKEKADVSLCAVMGGKR